MTTFLAGYITSYRVHPVPPPTVNNLTSHQKAQLRRSNTKLTKVLGAAPQVIDLCPGHIKVSHPLPTNAAKRMQPSLSISSGKKLHRRSKSASERIDPDLYPLSSALRPASHSIRRRRPSEGSSPSHLKRGSTVSSVSSRPRSRDLSAMFSPGIDEYANSSVPAVPALPSQTRSRPENESVAFSRDSLCDSLYEPSFTIPSASKLRREKMARVCKLLGEDVPVDLVFPAEEADGNDYDLVQDILPSSVEPLPVLSTEVPPPLPPKLPPAVPPKTEQKQQPQPQRPRWTSYRATLLETIVEQSPRLSYSSTLSADSACSLLTTTTSSSYRFTSSGCASTESPPSSSSSHAATGELCASQVVHKTDGTHGRREFAIYVPFHSRINGFGCGAEARKRGAQEFEVVRSMTDLRI